jgi:deoxyribose-phosphate aldolase
MRDIVETIKASGGIRVRRDAPELIFLSVSTARENF